MRIAKAINYDVNNGEGFRLSVWTTGCPIKCPNCHNKDLWDENLGQEYSIEVAEKIVELLRDDNIQGLSILGGEPLAPYNIDDVVSLCAYVRDKLPNKTVWLWTGYDIGKVKETPLINLLDVVIDGEYIERYKTSDLQWMGSGNQTITYLK